MNTISPGVFRVSDGEVITVEVRSTGAPTLFGVNPSIFGGGAPMTEGQPLQITMDKSRANLPSNISNAKATTLNLLFSFTSLKDGRYDVTMTGSEGGDSAQDFARQAGSTPKAIKYTFHIV